MHRDTCLTAIFATALACLTWAASSAVAAARQAAVLPANGAQATPETVGSARTTTVNGREIHYESHGEMRDDRPALVLVHGWASSTWAWHRQLPVMHLAANRRTRRRVPRRVPGLAEPLSGGG